MRSVELLDERVERELSSLPRDLRARFERIVSMICSHGLENVHEPYVKHIEGKLWEMRMKGRDGIARAIYVTARGKRIVVVRAFIKKSQKTPKNELAIAKQRAREVI